MFDQLSVVIITKNAAETLNDTLISTATFPEVVVYDNGSEDATIDIARGHSNVTVYQGEFMGFGPTKSHAVSLARNDWILSLDADEKVSTELLEYLGRWTPEDDQWVGIIRRDNYLMGKLVTRGGWGSDWLVRLFNRKTHRFNDKTVHEKVPLTTSSKAHRLAYPIEHAAVSELSDFLDKIDLYSEIRRQTTSKTFSPAVIFLRSLFAFFRSYVMRAGFLEGWRGLVIAWSNSNGVFYKYMKIYADQSVERQNKPGK